MAHSAVSYKRLHKINKANKDTAIKITVQNTVHYNENKSIVIRSLKFYVDTTIL